MSDNIFIHLNNGPRVKWVQRIWNVQVPRDLWVRSWLPTALYHHHWHWTSSPHPTLALPVPNCPLPPPTSSSGLADVFPSTCKSTPRTSVAHSQHLHCPFPTALYHHQRVPWDSLVCLPCFHLTFNPTNLCPHPQLPSNTTFLPGSQLPSNTTNESARPVGVCPGFQLPSTPSTSPARLVGVFPSFYLPFNTTNMRSRSQLPSTTNFQHHQPVARTRWSPSFQLPFNTTRVPTDVKFPQRDWIPRSKLSWLQKME